MKEVLINKWAVIANPWSLYQAPEIRFLCLSGEVFGHPDFPDGKRIVTSMIMHGDGDHVITRNTRYRLGDVDEDYREWYKVYFKKDLDRNCLFN